MCVLAAVALALVGACAAPPPPAQDVPSTIPEAHEAAVALSPVPHDLMESYRYWRIDGADLEDEAYLDQLQRRIRQDRAARALDVSPEEVMRGCIELMLKGCASRAGGVLRHGETVLWWQIQDGYTEEDGVGGGVIVFQAVGNRLRPILWDFEGGRYDAPLLIPVDAGLLLIAPGLSRGTGSGDSTVRAILRDGRWRPVDTRWQDRARDQLGGFSVYHQPRWNFEDLSAWTPLWRSDDANCCGTAGTADIDFDIVDDRLTVVGARLRGPAGEAAP